MRTCMSAQLKEVLLGYLEGTDARGWPVAEGMTVQDILLSYPQAIASGQVPDRQQPAVMDIAPSARGTRADVTYIRRQPVRRNMSRPVQL